MKKKNIFFVAIYLFIFVFSTNIYAQVRGNLVYRTPSSTITMSGGTNKEKAVDGDCGSTYGAGFNGTVTFTYQIDFENPCSVDTVKMYWSKIPNNFNLKISLWYADGIDDWYIVDEPIATTASTTQTIVTYAQPEPDANYFTKIKIQFTSSGILRLNEIQVKGFQTEFTNGTSYNDTRDGQMYRTVVLNGQTWFKDNLNYNYSNHSWYHASVTTDANKLKYGRLYDHPETIYSNVCPTDWRLPTETELYNLQGNLFPSGAMEVPRGGWYKSYASCQGCQPEGYYQFDIVSHVLTSTISQAGGMITNGTSTQYPSVHTGYFPFDSRVSVRCVKSSKSENNLDTIKAPYEQFGVYSPDGIKLDTCEITSSVKNLQETVKLTVYPNPTDGKFIIDLGFEPQNNAILQIISLDGRIIFEKNVVNRINDIILTTKMQGLYLIMINYNNQIITEKVMLK